MKTNLKVILAAAGVAALLASPATAKTARHHAVPTYGAFQSGPYTPSIPTPRYGRGRDFQNGSRG